MSAIQNIDRAMIDEHVAWHSKAGNPAQGGRVINPWPPGGGGPAAGSGEEFLVWHQGYLQRFRDWVALAPAERPDPDSIRAWTEIPMMLKMGMVGWNQQYAQDEARLQDMTSFATLDELGRFLEWGLHGWLHRAAASMWNEPVLTTYESPRSTYFWQLHGLIDHWRQQWIDAHRRPQIPQRDDLLQLLRELLHRVPRIPLPRPPRPWPPWPFGPRPGPGPDPSPELLSEPERDLIREFRLLNHRVDGGGNSHG